MAKALARLIDVEAGRIGGNFEQNAARLAKINRAKIFAIDLRGRMQVMLVGKLSCHCCLRRVINGAESDMVPLRVVDVWLRDYHEFWAQSLQSLKRYVEEDR